MLYICYICYVIVMLKLYVIVIRMKYKIWIETLYEDNVAHYNKVLWQIDI